MIADKHDLKKIHRKEKEFQKLFEIIPVKFENVVLHIIKDQKNVLVDEKVNRDYQKITKKLLKILEIDLEEVSLYNKLKFTLLNVEYIRLKELVKIYPSNKAVDLFIENIDNCRSKPSDEIIKTVFEKYRKHFDNKFGNIDSLEFVQILKKGELLINPLIKKLRKEIDQSENYFIESLNYNLLESKFLLYYVLDYYRYDLQPVLEDVFNKLKIELNFLDPVSLHGMALYKIENYKKMFQEQKNKIIPLSISENLGLQQDDMLKVYSKGIELLQLISFDILFDDIKEFFSFRVENRIKLASVLYDFFLITHRVHPVYEFYTEKEWWDEQDKKGNLPTNRKWKNHKLLRVKNIIPNF